MTQICCCSHLIRTPHRGAGVLVLLVRSHGQLTPLPLGLFFSNVHILHQGQCFVQMQQPLAVMHQTLGLVPIEVVTTYNYGNQKQLTSDKVGQSPQPVKKRGCHLWFVAWEVHSDTIPSANAVH